MFQVNDTILYGADGICEITEIASRTFGGKTQEYYVLRPVDSAQATIYVPTRSEKLLAKMRRMLSPEEIHEIIRSLPEETPFWIEDENERKRAYGEILRGGDRRAMIRLMKALHQRQQELKATGRKFHACDERFMKDAEKTLFHEFAHVLHMRPEQVDSFIRQQLDQAERARRTRGTVPRA